MAVVRAAEAVPRRWQVAATAGLALAVIAQPLLADVRTARVLGRQDTLSQAREFLDSHYAPGLRVSIEPAVPGRYFRSNPEGSIPSWLTRCAQRPGWTEPGWSYASAGGRQVCDRYKPALFARPDGRHPPPARLHAGVRPAADPGPEGRRAGAVLLAR